MDDTTRSTERFGPDYTSSKETSDLVKGATDGRTASHENNGRPSLRCIAATEDFTCYEERFANRLQEILDGLAGAEDSTPETQPAATQTTHTNCLTTRSGKSYPSRLN